MSRSFRWALSLLAIAGLSSAANAQMKTPKPQRSDTRFDMKPGQIHAPDIMSVRGGTVPP
jgi:hypothetical protein